MQRDILHEQINIKVHPQINLATVIKKISNQRYQNELYRNIDFAIFNYDYTKLLLLVEINDSSHNEKNRKKRDHSVDEIVKQANIRLIKYYTNKPNDRNYVKERIKKEISTK